MSKTLEHPTQLRLPADLKQRAGKIAEANGLKISDVFRLLIAQGLPTIEQNGITIPPTARPKRKAA